MLGRAGCGLRLRRQPTPLLQLAPPLTPLRPACVCEQEAPETEQERLLKEEQDIMRQVTQKQARRRRSPALGARWSTGGRLCAAWQPAESSALAVCTPAAPLHPHIVPAAGAQDVQGAGDGHELRKGDQHGMAPAAALPHHERRRAPGERVEERGGLGV